MCSRAHIFLMWVMLVARVRGEECSVSYNCNTPYEVCDEGTCSHKPLLPIITNDALSPPLLMIGIALSNAAGIGGGAISMPILLALLGFAHPEAVAISNFLMLLGAVARIIISFKEKNPRFPHKLAVSYDFIIILLPLALVGTLIGLLINQTFPAPILSICTVCLFLFVIYKSFTKGISLRAKEKQALQEGADPLIKRNATAGNSAAVSFPIEEDQPSEAKELIKREGSHWQPKKQALILTVLTSLIVLTLLRGNGHSQSVIQRCSGSDWLVQGLFLLICLICVAIAGGILSRQNQIRAEAGHPIDVKWTHSTIYKFAALSIAVGLISGGLGLGGGVIVTPILFSKDQPPSVASLTSVYLIFFSTLSGSIQFMILGRLNYQYALFNGVFVLIGSITGLWLIGSWVRRSNKQSVLVFLLTFVAIFAVCSVAVFEGLKVKSDLDKGKDIWQFTSFCSN